MRMSRRKRGAAANIPIDILEEILHRLPSNDLLKFKIVSKEWLGLILSHSFIQKHLERSISGCNGAWLLTPNNTTSAQEMTDLENNFAKKIHLGDVHSFLGSCDGLVLYWLHDCKIAAVNPSTGKYVVRTPNPSLHNDIMNIEDRVFTCSWFGHHPFTGEYVLVLANLSKLEGESYEHFIFNAYSLSCNNSLLSSSTYHITDEGCCSFGQVGTFLHSRLHCTVGLLSSVEIIILVYSFQKNIKIERMGCPVNCGPMLGVLDGCLSMICKVEGVYEVWVMKEYGVEKSWTKFANIEAYNIIYDEYILSMIIPVVFCPNGYIILKDNDDGLGITTCIASFKRISNATTYNRLGGVVCIDSLVSPHSLVLGEEEAIVE